MCLAWLFAAKPLANAARGTALERVAEGAARFKALVALALASAAVALGLAPGVSVVGEVPQGLPPIKLDVLSTTERVENMLPGAALVAIVVFVSSFASAKSALCTAATTSIRRRRCGPSARRTSPRRRAAASRCRSGCRARRWRFRWACARKSRVCLPPA